MTTMLTRYSTLIGWAWAAAMLGLPQVLLAASKPAPVAMVSELQGKGALVSGGSRSALSMLAELEPGSQLELDAGARAVVLYLDGSGEYVIGGPAVITFGAREPQAVKGAAPQKRSVLGGKAGSDVRLKPLGSVQGALVMRSAGPRGRIRVVNPTAKTLEIRPEFRWQFEQPGASYRFELIDETGNTVYETEVAGTSLKLPAAVALKENAPYTWMVATRLADGRKYSSTSEFTIAPRSVREQVLSLRPTGDAPLSERVAYGAWLEQLELRDAAREVWRALAAERPDEPRLQAIARE